MRSKSVIITGASSGIGKACADELSADGHQVVNADIEFVDNPNAHHVQCDVSNGADIDKLYAKVKESYGIPDVLISNAGVGIHEKLSEGDPEKWQKVLQTNIMGPLRLIRAFLPEMLARESGHIVFISSVAAGKPHPYGGIYAASKSALEVVAETLRLEVQPHLKVSVVAPGAIDTAFFENTLSGPRSYAELGWARVTPQDIARHVKYLLNLPDHVNLDHSVIRPGDQPF